MMIADGMRKAAERLGDSNVAAVKLTKIEKTGKVLNGKRTILFWANTNQGNGPLIIPNVIN